jgi:hypothetical protein
MSTHTQFSQIYQSINVYVMGGGVGGMIYEQIVKKISSDVLRAPEPQLCDPIRLLNADV